MERTTGEAPATGQELYRFLDRTLFWLEAATIAVLLLITLARPTTSRAGLPTWGLVLLFRRLQSARALLRRRLLSLRSFACRYVVDLEEEGRGVAVHSVHGQRRESEDVGVGGGPPASSEEPPSSASSWRWPSSCFVECARGSETGQGPDHRTPDGGGAPGNGRDDPGSAD